MPPAESGTEGLRQVPPDLLAAEVHTYKSGPAPRDDAAFRANNRGSPKPSKRPSMGCRRVVVSRDLTVDLLVKPVEVGRRNGSGHAAR
jgi:hypothetical protein